MYAIDKFWVILEINQFYQVFYKEKWVKCVVIVQRPHPCISVNKALSPAYARQGRIRCQQTLECSNMNKAQLLYSIHIIQDIGMKALKVGWEKWFKKRYVIR